MNEETGVVSTHEIVLQKVIEKIVSFKLILLLFFSSKLNIGNESCYNMMGKCRELAKVKKYHHNMMKEKNLNIKEDFE